jgi:mycofactocin system transcriptional regulator
MLRQPRPLGAGAGPAVVGTRALGARGRPPATSRDELERAAFALFAERGFEQTTVEEIAAAAGIGRRTFFRYFATKNDVVWGDFEGHLDRLRSDLAAVGPHVPVAVALIESIVAFNDYPLDELPRHRQRMHLILGTAELQAHSTLQFAKWRQVIADFVADRHGCPASDLEPQVVAHTALGTCLAAYGAWMDDDAGDLTGLLRRAFAGWATTAPDDVSRPAVSRRGA